jgi:carbonic anhydrase
MSKNYFDFFTTVGCMDGRAQEVVSSYGKERFGARFADTITEAGMDGLFLENAKSAEKLIKDKILVSVEKHRSKGILVHGHEDCAGNPVDEERHKEGVRKGVEIIKKLVNNKVPVEGIYIRFEPEVKIEVI